jgi:hypothetical protein
VTSSIFYRLLNLVWLNRMHNKWMNESNNDMLISHYLIFKNNYIVPNFNKGMLCYVTISISSWYVSMIGFMEKIKMMMMTIYKRFWFSYVLFIIIIVHCVHGLLTYGTQQACREFYQFQMFGGIWFWVIYNF